MPMTGSIDRVEVITSVQRRRRWSAEEKARIVQETYAPGMSVLLIARQHGGGAEPGVQMAAALRRGRAVPLLFEHSGGHPVIMR
jgi:Transposase